ncbi:MAG: HEAT repeat domain-containing protein, partial [Planctomycetaceae bacterium]
DDPNAVSSLRRLFQQDENKALRRLYVAALTQIPGEGSAVALAQQAIFDADAEVRYEALGGLSSSQVPAALPLFVKALRNDWNPAVVRAGTALGQHGDEQVVPELINALVTEHQYKIRVPDASGMSFSTDGSFSLGGGQQAALPPEIEVMLRTGQLPHGVIVTMPQSRLRRTKVVTINHQHQNVSVLGALRTITGENHGYDKTAWRVWFAKKKKGALPPE